MSEHESPQDEIDEASLTVNMSRRTLMKAAAVTAAAGTGSAYMLYEGTSEVAAELGPIDWDVDGATVETGDGQISDVLLDDGGDEGEGIEAAWENFSGDSVDITFEVEVRVQESDNEVDAAAEEYEAILVDGTVTVEETPDGNESWDWEDVWSSEDVPVSVLDHSAIDDEQFAADDDGSTVETTLELRLSASADVSGEGDVEDEDETTATVIVSNEGAEIEIGGEGQIEIEE